MIRSRTPGLALGLVLVLAAGPAHALAPAKGRDRVVEPPVDPASERGGDGEALDPETGAREGVEPSTEPALDPGEPVVDPEAEGDAEGDPSPETDPDEPVVGPEPAADEPDPPPLDPSTHDVPADDFEAESGLAPGGYYGHGAILERAPPDGHNRIIVGSILVPLGTLAIVSSAVGTWMTVPSHCAERLGAAGIEATASRCQGLFTFNVIRTSYGALMLGSGATILVLGMLQRERYRKWRHEHGMKARLEPAIALPGRGTASVGLRVRF